MTLLRTRGVQLKDAGVAAFVAEAHPVQGDGRGVLGRRGQLYVLLSAHAVSVARLVAQQGLVLHIQPADLPQRFTSFPGEGAGQSEGLLHWSLQVLWCCYPA